MKEFNSASMNDHEEQFARAFIVPEKRERYLSLLQSKRGRRKLVAGFHHCHDLDDRFARLIPSDQQSAGSIEQILKKHGAPEVCYVMADDENIDGTEMNLTDALSQVVGMDAGALISCIPGKLAYFEMEGLGKRYLLIRGGSNDTSNR
jgi:hypothetical protein